MKHKYYSQEQIDRLSKDPRVKHIDEYRWIFTFEFRLYLWEMFYPNFTTASVRRALVDEGFDINDLKMNKYFIHNLTMSLKFRKPCGSKNDTFGICCARQNLKADRSYDDYLLSTGKFIKSRRGIAFTETYKNEIYHTYPDVSILDHLIKDGFNAERIGYQRIYLLEKEFKGEISTNHAYPEEMIDALKTHPYIKTITTKQIRFHIQFYNEACSLAVLPIDEILQIFDIDFRLIPISKKYSLKYELAHWKKKKIKIEIPASGRLIRIQRNIQNELNKLLLDRFTILQKKIHSFGWKERKQVCEIIRKMPHDEQRIYTKRRLLKLAGISKTNYYDILKDPDYGSYQRTKEKQDSKDIQLIKKVIDFKGYSKGTRTIQMMMPSICNTHMGRNKIRRLCKKAGLICPIRKANASRKSAQELLKRNVKPNLVKRRFRLARPNEILLTDVSYLKYGDKKMAYLSDIKDSVTGKIVAYSISDCNDLSLVLDTLDQLVPSADKEVIFHSDQGALYLSDTFQNRIKELGYKESMSRRGNCWDNASKESYYGHFKDECSYFECQTLDELKAKVSEYIYYYNYERPQWERMKMTPVAYENYMNHLSDEEYQLYLEKEETKYQKMMDRSAEKARKRATELGA